MQKSDKCCFSGHKPQKNEKSKNEKNSEVKKNFHSPATSSNSRNRSLSGQALS